MDISHSVKSGIGSSQMDGRQSALSRSFINIYDYKQG